MMEPNASSKLHPIWQGEMATNWKERCADGIRQSFFPRRMVLQWNRLHEQTEESPSLVFSTLNQAKLWLTQSSAGNNLFLDRRLD